MTNPFQPAAPPVFAQPASPFGQPQPAPAPVNDGMFRQAVDPRFGQPAPAGGPLGVLAGLGAPQASPKGLGINVSGLLGYLLLIVPTSVQYGVARPNNDKGETQTRVIADTLIIRPPAQNLAPDGRLTIICPGAVGMPARQVSHYVHPETGEPDPSRPFIHNPAAGQFVAIDGMWWHDVPAEKLLPCLDPKRPDLTMIAAYPENHQGKTTRYNRLIEPHGNQAANTGDWPEINAVASAWLATRSQFG